MPYVSYRSHKTIEVRQRIHDAVYEGRIDNMSTNDAATYLGVMPQTVLKYLTDIVIGLSNDNRFVSVEDMKETVYIKGKQRFTRRALPQEYTKTGKAKPLQFVWVLC